MTYHRINGVDLYSEVTGEGRPILFLHGGFCSLEALREQADALAAERTVYAFERPGHGRSADIDGGYNYERGLADTLAYLDAEGLEPVDVLGYSDGAILGLLLALHHPERVRSLIAISGNLDPSAFNTNDDAGGLPVLGPPVHAAPKDPDKPDLERLAYERLSPDGPAHADAVMAKLFRLWTTEPHIDPAELAAIKAPTLIMSGDRDTIRPDHSLLIASSIPGAQLCIVPGATHGLLAERPALISAVVREFLQQVP
ncbi:alpha/beta fold hydrolase [Arthrobacter caoxuetaonis]|uniref:Alpha/beta hydrolase n=1 Tax=Arthrobacter caoxuetaonis TaxID=2886935 RepID=A0A9X1MEX0_9MICC|nr:alpha/beta hydrolase [Arthrobacter caoxuetaonis]MCC3298067.1 alpha/beta hydrolase [Arthrobacter caoxuetaonis]USQ57077.1 alpha/beta hydrolase [Arthrobacter caoxuetaonis]